MLYPEQLVDALVPAKKALTFEISPSQHLIEMSVLKYVIKYATAIANKGILATFRTSLSGLSTAIV